MPVAVIRDLPEYEPPTEPDFAPLPEPDVQPGPEREPRIPVPTEPDVSPPGPEPQRTPPGPGPVVIPSAPEPPAVGAATQPGSSPFAQQAMDPSLMVGQSADISAGLEKSRLGFMARLRTAFGTESGATLWEDVEETLIAGDVGAALAMEVVERARGRRDAATPEEAVRSELAALLAPQDPAWRPEPAGPGQPAVVLIVGVNGTGKTTTIGKLAQLYGGEGRRVILASADTFRAAAIEQLAVWAGRADAEVVAHAPGADPGAVVFDALDAAVARHADVVIADTAGRLHTKVNLMDELSKIRRIVDKRLPGARPETLFILDATTGQNGLAQARAFHDAVGLTGIVLTKLDSTSKGGIVFAIEDARHLPVRYVGVGEKVGDLVPFDPDGFVAALFESTG